MYFDSTKETDKKRALTYFQSLLEKEKRFEIIEKRSKRTLNQNNYLHLIISWFALEYGEQVEYIKQEYFKRLCNPELFVTHKEDNYLGKVIVLKSSADLDTKQMTEAIERFRNWSSSEAGIYLPEPNEEEFLHNIQVEMQRQKKWL